MMVYLINSSFGYFLVQRQESNIFQLRYTIIYLCKDILDYNPWFDRCQLTISSFCGKLMSIMRGGIAYDPH